MEDSNQKTTEKQDCEAEPLPDGFFYSDGGDGERPGLYCSIKPSKGAPLEKVWMGATLRVLGKTRDENNGSWGLLLEWHDEDGVSHTWIMPNSMLFSINHFELLSALSEGGWKCSSDSRVNKKIAQFLSDYKTEARIRNVPRTGWYEGAFVLPDEVIKSPSSQDSERLCLQSPSSKHPYRKKDTMKAWQSSIGEMARGNSRLMLMMCSCFAAPLIEVSGQESGGFHFFGKSTAGKSTSLLAAASVWGSGARSGGYVRTWRSTSNGLEGIAALHSDTLLCLDEIGEAGCKALSDSVYMLANGSGKTRASRNGEARMPKEWRCMWLSTGEKTVAEKMAEEKIKVQAGQEVRLIDIPADAEAGYGMFENLHDYLSAEAFAGAINEAAATNYGHAGPAFVRSLLENIEEAKTALPPKKIIEAANMLLSGVGNASEQVKRAARRFALCAIAGEMASQWGIVPWERGEALESIKKCFEAYVSHRDGVGSAEDTAIVREVMHFIEQHGASRFQAHDDLTSKVYNRAGFRQNIGNKTYYYCLPQCFKTDICKGFSVKNVCHVLWDRELLEKTEQGTFQNKPHVELPDGWGWKRCYTIVIDNEEELPKVLRKVEVNDPELQKILSEGEVATRFVATGEEAEKFDDPMNKSVPYNE